MSVHHPGSLSWAAVYGRALATPLAACMLPVMVLTLVAVLEGLIVVPYAFWAAGAAIGAAALWTTFRLNIRLAEIRVDEAWVQVYSVAELIRRDAEPPRRVLDVREYDGWSHVTIGLSPFEISRAEWPDYENLITALRNAQQVSYSPRTA